MTVRTFLWTNLLFAGVLVVAIVASFFLADPLAARLVQKYGGSLDIDQLLLAMRLMLGCGILAAVFLHRIFARLLAIIATIEGGDPFTLDNARRLGSIGWALLAVQLMDLMLGGFTAWFHALRVDFTAWSPALGGWIAVLMTFVLARVFRRGAAMRDELAMTV